MLQRFKPDNSLQPPGLRKVNDQGIAQRPPLGLKNAGKGQRLKGIPGKAIDRFGRKGDDFPGAKQCHGFPNPLLPFQNPSAHEWKKMPA